MPHVENPDPPETWPAARRAAAAIAAPIQRILAIEAASGVVLLVATAIALIWANVWSDSYADVWHTAIGGGVGSWSYERPVQFWVNDGLMTVFFFVVGLEIRREIFEGELATIKKAALPLAAAVGGMLVPAAVFAMLNAGRAGVGGWAIPMATDIAFAVGVLTLLGSRVPSALRVLLLALAVIDDIGAIIVIALFYSAGLSLQGLVVIGVGIAALLAVRAAGGRAALLYVVPGTVVWAGFLMTGIHPTIAGVVLGLLTPVSRVDRLIHWLHPWVAFVVMPMFALANAGVVFGGARFNGDYLWLFAGVVCGLALGKPVGIAAASLSASRTRIATRSSEVTRQGVVLVGLVGGIGFTMSLFIAQLAFPSGPLLDTAKLAILVGSGVASLVGLTFGFLIRRRRQ